MTDPLSHSPEVLVDGTLVPAAETLAYTSPSGAGTRGTRINLLTLTNQTTSARVVQVWIVESGGSAGNANRVVNMTIPADGFPYSFLGGFILDPGDEVRWEADVVSTVAGRLSGWEMTD